MRAPVLAVDDGVDHGVEGEMPRQGEAALFLRVAEYNVEELVADDGLDLLVRPAVLPEEIEVHEEPRPPLAGHGESGHGRREDDIEDLEQRADGERILVDELHDEVPESFFGDRVHA